MRTIFLSPHLDDAVLSAGGLIRDRASQGGEVEIWTLMSGFPGDQALSDFAREMHAKWGTTTADETIRLRRAEDQRAAAVVGAQPVYFDFYDCLYRKDSDGKPSYSDAMYTPMHACDVGLPGDIAKALRKKLKPDDVVVCQLGIGEHVDHLLVRSAAEMLERPLVYDADVPYVFNYSEELRPKTASMQTSLEPISADGLDAWLEAILAYRSQLSSLFESVDGLLQRVRSYAAQEGGIRLWSPRGGGPALPGSSRAVLPRRD